MLSNQTSLKTSGAQINLARSHKLASVRPIVSHKSSTSASDDLTMIKGIGKVIQKALYAKGIHTYRQIANFDAANINWVNNYLDFSGRIERDKWIPQAVKLLAAQQAQNQAGASETMKPELLVKPINGVADDFKRIKGIGLVLERALHKLGIYHYQQLATLTVDNMKWVEQRVGFPGRIKRENWTVQARALASGNNTEYSNRFDNGQTPYQA